MSGEGATKRRSPSAPILDFGRAWEYAPSPEAADDVVLASRWNLFIGGTWRPPRTDRYAATRSPFSEGPIAEVAEAGVRDVDDAVRAALRAREGVWSRMRGAERTKCLLRLARAIEGASRELAIVESMNTGRPIAYARDVDMRLSASYLFYYAGWADKLDCAFHGSRSVRALGVVGLVVASDCPLPTAAWSLAPALACGNAVVLHPPTGAPLTALMLARLVEESGLPPGVVNVVTGDAAVGEAIAAHPGIDGVTFAGSKAAGATVRRAALGCAKKKRLALHLDGRPVVVVFADAALDQAVDAVVRGLSAHRGPGGCCAPVLLVEENIHDRIVGKLRDRMATLRLGDPLDKNTDVGPLLSRARLEEIDAWIASAEADGADRCTAPASGAEKGAWLAPTLVTNVAASSCVVREPIAGPVLSILTFRRPDEAVEAANALSDGRCAGVWTERGSKGLALAERLKAGVLWCNTYGKIEASSPFGLAGGRQGLFPYVEAE